ncbi:hypothetical protein [Herpetosiphon gulosus]|uniref:PH domain-containing protein n=1 Tax=Herpetosiphon gulosus TaxID=1973496 RepID=A0ABP9X1C7_9CHLR
MMQTAHFHVREYWLKWITLIAAIVAAGWSVFRVNDPDLSILYWWGMLMWLLLASRMLVDLISSLDFTPRGLVMRRGWQYFEIPWEQIESVGISRYTRRDLPYIVLRVPIRGLPSVKIPELIPEEQQRTLTLEGWDEPEAVAAALCAGLKTTAQDWQVIPDFALSHRYFVYYQRLYLWILTAGVALFAYLILR